MLRDPKIKTLILLLVCVGLIIFLEKYRPPVQNSLWRSIMNTGHTPLFGLLSLMFFGLSSILLDKFAKNRFTHFIIAFIASSVAGLVSELFQIVGPRDADLGDLLRDVAGIFIFLGLYSTFDQKLKDQSEKFRGYVYKFAMRTITIALFLVMISPPVIWGIAFLERESKFPVLCDFDSYWSRKFVKTQDAEMEIVPAPEDIAEGKDDMVARVTFMPANYPGLKIFEPYPDWRGYDYLEFEVFSGLDSTISLALVITDIHHNNEYNDRFTTGLKINPGSNHIRVPLEKIRHAPIDRLLDMENIASLLVFMYKIEDLYVLHIDDFGIE